MKKQIVYLLVVFFIVGCGSRSDDQASSQSDGQQQMATNRGSSFIEEGMNYLQQQDVANAIRSFDNAIKSDPANPENYIVLGQVYLRLNDYNRAVDTLNAATRVDPNNGELHYLLATTNATRLRIHADEEGAGEFRMQAIASAKRAVEIFMIQKDDEKFKKAVVLLKSLSEEMPSITDMPETSIE